MYKIKLFFRHIVSLAALFLIASSCNNIKKHGEKTPFSDSTPQTTDIHNLDIPSVDEYCKVVKGIELTKADRDICSIVRIDTALAYCLKTISKNSLQLAPRVNEYGEMLNTKDSACLSSLLSSKSNVYDLLPDLKNQFGNKGFLVFVSNDDANNDYLTAIKGKDEMDIIKWRQTNGVNHGHENKDVLAKLKEWKEKYDFIVLQVGMDMVWLEFRKMPADMDAFVQEVYKFCPDIVDQGAGDLATLKKELIKIHGVYLWWD